MTRPFIQYTRTITVFLMVIFTILVTWAFPETREALSRHAAYLYNHGSPENVLGSVAALNSLITAAIMLSCLVLMFIFVVLYLYMYFRWFIVKEHTYKLVVKLTRKSGPEIDSERDLWNIEEYFPVLLKYSMSKFYHYIITVVPHKVANLMVLQLVEHIKENRETFLIDIDKFIPPEAV